MRKMLGQREKKKRLKEESEERKEGSKERCRRGKSDEKMCKPLEMSIPVFPPTSDRKQVNLLPISFCPKASIRLKLDS